MTPMEPGPPAVNAAAPLDAPAATMEYRWYHRLIAVLFATFCLEIGFFLLVFPWTGWARDFAAFRPEWRPYWDNMYVRGAVSGLGVINLYISLIEIANLKRFARR